MAFDFKKEYKEFYLPKAKPELVTVPPMNYIAVRGKGDPNEEDGAYKQAIGLLYGIAYTIKMSKKGSHQIDGYFDFVVPPLEGFWQQSGSNTIDYAHKENFGHPPAGFCHESGFRLGRAGSCCQEKAGFFPGRISHGG